MPSSLFQKRTVAFMTHYFNYCEPYVVGSHLCDMDSDSSLYPLEDAANSLVQSTTCQRRSWNKHY